MYTFIYTIFWSKIAKNTRKYLKIGQVGDFFRKFKTYNDLKTLLPRFSKILLGDFDAKT